MRIFLIRLATKYYRIIKTWLLKQNPPFITGIFFSIVVLLDYVLSGRKLTKQEQLANVLWKQGYFAYWKEHQDILFELRTEHPVALNADDHTHPRGSIQDNSRNPRFNHKLYALLEFRDDISLLDLGCAGGGLVRSFLEDGYVAIGLEGSDVSKKARSGEWDTIPYHLFTCDITKPFQIYIRNRMPVMFDVVTAWEVFEHIREDDLGPLIENILRHLKPRGYLICSIDMLPDGNPLSGTVYHHTLHSKEWWEKILRNTAFAPPQIIHLTVVTWFGVMASR